MPLNKDFVSSKMTQYSNDQMSDDEKLKKVATKAIKTTMIGSLSVIEKEMGFLWNHGSYEALTEEEEQMKAIYEKVRQSILDNGNEQIRNLGKALSAEYRTMTLPVKGPGQ